MTIKSFMDICPKSERTIQSHNYNWKGYKFINDQGEPCLYRVLEPSGNDMGMIYFYGGRLLSSYNYA